MILAGFESFFRIFAGFNSFHEFAHVDIFIADDFAVVVESDACDIAFGEVQVTFNSSAVGREIIKTLCYVFVFIVAFNINNKKSQFNRILTTIIGLGVFLSAYGIVKRYFFQVNEVTRVSSTFANADHFAGYLIMIVPIALGYALYSTKVIKKYLFGVSAAFMSATIFLTFSRAGILSLVLTIIFMFFLLRDIKINTS